MVPANIHGLTQRQEPAGQRNTAGISLGQRSTCFPRNTCQGLGNITGFKECSKDRTLSPTSRALVPGACGAHDAHLHRLRGGGDDGWVALDGLRGRRRWGWWLGGHWWGSLQWLGRHHRHDRSLHDEVWGDGEGVRRGLNSWRVLLSSLGLRRS